MRRVLILHRRSTLLRFLATALACACSLFDAETEDTVRKSAPVSSATRVTLNAEFGSIGIQPGAGRTVDVEVYFHGYPPSRAEFDRMLHDFKLDIAQQGSDVRVEATFINGWESFRASGIFDVIFGHQICHNGRCLKYTWLRGAEYRLTVPRQIDAHLTTSGGAISVGRLKGEVTAHTSGGSLNFDRIDGPVNGSTSGGSITLAGAKGRTVVHTSGGSIHITDVTGDVEASTSGGSISIDDVSGRVKVHTSGGRINASEITGSIDASTSGGPVTASLLAQPLEECRFNTSGGSINVSLASNLHVNLDASTSGGRVSTDLPVTVTGELRRNELHGTLNGGGPLLYLHTSGGGISVKSAHSL
jgi:hypothetical protein